MRESEADPETFVLNLAVWFGPKILVISGPITNARHHS
jgi:hypothetical protein